MSRTEKAFKVKLARKATRKSIKKEFKSIKKAVTQIAPREDFKLDNSVKVKSNVPKEQRYKAAHKNLENWLVKHPEATEQEKQMFLSESLSSFFAEFSFVGFYDAKVGDNQKIYIGEYFSNDEIFPCGEIKYGSGQCGLCAKLKKVMIAVDTKLLDNYIACDANTRSEIVIPILNKDGSFRTQLDIDSPAIGTFTVED